MDDMALILGSSTFRRQRLDAPQAKILHEFPKMPPFSMESQAIVHECFALWLHSDCFIAIEMRLPQLLTLPTFFAVCRCRRCLISEER